MFGSSYIYAAYLANSLTTIGTNNTQTIEGFILEGKVVIG